MKKLLKLLVVLVICILSLVGCETEQVEEETNTISLASCMKNDNIAKSQKGTNLTYYYRDNDCLSIYYITSWKNAKLSVKRYYTNQEAYELRKSLEKDAKYSDSDKKVSLSNYEEIADMDAYWDEIASSSIYTIVE
jgi:uncharacterized lipoprotein YehR (DUF1307 family)